LLILRIFFTERVCLNPKHKVADRFYQIPNQVALELTPAAAKSHVVRGAAAPPLGRPRDAAQAAAALAPAAPPPRGGGGAGVRR
jgi:hypothetical protein